MTLHLQRLHFIQTLQKYDTNGVFTQFYALEQNLNPRYISICKSQIF